ncbi:MAG: class I SAM-dependent DNA methyltransferase [bacterium]
MAFIYDFIMRHVDYHRWANYINSLLLKASSPTSKILDIACGTGSLLLKLAELNYRVAGFDESENMVKIAQKNARKQHKSVPFWRGSMLDFAVHNKFGAVVCTYDSMNYCLTPSCINSIFLNTYDVLHPGGLFIFDICTEKNSRRNFLKYFEKDSTDDFRYVRESYYMPRKRFQINEFEIIWNQDSSIIYHEIHKQRIYKIEEIKNKIPHELFLLEGIYEGFSMHKGTEKSDRVHFVLKKK